MPALQVIPVNGSVIASNDLFYPANNYARHDRQFQIASLFGHQAFGAGLFYDQAVDTNARVNDQKLLQQSVWGEMLTKIACERGWTHVLLSKRVPRVEAVPGTLLYESPYYTVYALPTCSAA